MFPIDNGPPPPRPPAPNYGHTQEGGWRGGAEGRAAEAGDERRRGEGGGQ